MNQPAIILKRLVLAAAVTVSAPAALADDELERARELVQRLHLVDTHVDVPYRLEEKWEDVTRGTAEGDFDLPRARAGGLDTPFMSIYTPASKEVAGGTFELANRLIDGVEALVGRDPENFTMVSSVAEAELAFSTGKIGLALGMENGAPLEGKLENVVHFHERGVRYITLAHSKSNHMSDSSYDDKKIWGGLSPFGRQVVAEMNRVGMMVDISHLSDDAVREVLAISRAPVIASHSSARHFTPGWERNLSDELIRALADNGGVLMINFGSSFVTEEGRAWYDRFSPLRDAWADENKVSRDGPEAKDFERRYREAHPFPFASVNDVADHFDHVVGLVGIDHVGIGSDFDGVGDSLPEGLKDVTGYPNLVAELLRRGYSEEDIGKILGGNLLRAWRQVEEHARALATAD